MIKFKGMDPAKKREECFKVRVMKYKTFAEVKRHIETKCAEEPKP
jgi:hypothetical protein